MVLILVVREDGKSPSLVDDLRQHLDEVNISVNSRPNDGDGIMVYDASHRSIPWDDEVDASFGIGEFQSGEHKPQFLVDESTALARIMDAWLQASDQPAEEAGEQIGG